LVFFITPALAPKKPPTMNDEGELVAAEEDPIDEEELKEMLKPKF
jgi:hypothetical protein